MSSRLEAALSAAAVLILVLAAFALPAGASPAGPLPPVAAGDAASFALYGSALTGWGFGQNNTSNPGPHLFVSYASTVQLTLVSIDPASTQHNWFIDYNNNSIPDKGEPSSPLFWAGNSIVWNFTADQIGTFTYRCEIHPSSMEGLITVSAPTRYTLYGSVLNTAGWGFNATDIRAPGPTLVIEAGAPINLTLISADGVTHSFFIDFNNNSARDPSEPESPDFGGQGYPSTVNYTLETNITGTYAYRCGFHPTQMWGMIIIVGKGTGVQGGYPIGLIPGIMLVVIVGVLILAVTYQVRASRAARRKK